MKAKALQERMLTALRPDHPGAEPVRWQQRKSALTRERLLESAIGCLVERGYGGLSTKEVAERTGISRGAMAHHFATRMDLVAALVDHTFYFRLKHFLAEYLVALHERGEDELVETAAEYHWRSVNSREYAAYLELAVAARTNAELEKVFTPAALRYDSVWTSEMIEAFPQWKRQWDAMKLANDFALSAHMGLLLNRPVFGDSDRLDAVRNLITRVIQSLYELS